MLGADACKATRGTSMALERMKKHLRRWLVTAALIAGVLSGASALDAGATAKPPIEWLAVPVILIGSFIGTMLVVGFQVVRRDPTPGRWALMAFEPMSVFMSASGLGAVALSAYRGPLVPHAAAFLALGFGALLAVGLCWRILHRRFRNAL